MVLPAILAGASVLTSAIPAIVAATRKPTYTGPTSEQLAAYSETSAIGNKQMMGAGLSETEYNRGSEQIQSGANQIAAQGMGAARNVPLISNVVAERIARQAMQQASGLLSEGRKELLITDIQKASKDLSEAAKTKAMAAAQAAEITKAKLRKQMQDQHAQQNMVANFAAVAGGAAKNAMAVYSIYNNAGTGTTSEGTITDVKKATETGAAAKVFERSSTFNADTSTADQVKVPVVNSNESMFSFTPDPFLDIFDYSMGTLDARNYGVMNG